MTDMQLSKQDVLSRKPAKMPKWVMFVVGTPLFLMAVGALNELQTRPHPHETHAISRQDEARLKRQQAAIAHDEWAVARMKEAYADMRSSYASMLTASSASEREHYATIWQNARSAFDHYDAEGKAAEAEFRNAQ